MTTPDTPHDATRPALVTVVGAKVAARQGVLSAVGSDSQDDGTAA